MRVTRDRLQSLGWGFVLVICTALTLALTFRVNAVKSEVRLADRRIVALRQEKMFLETEFETRANQQQLKSLNDVDFGYEAPTAGQYLESERQLAALGKPRDADAPAPIRMAVADGALHGASDGASDGGSSEGGASEGGVGGLRAMLSPLTGKAMAAQAPGPSPRVADFAHTPRHHRVSGAAGLSALLAHIDHAAARRARNDVPETSE